MENDCSSLSINKGSPLNLKQNFWRSLFEENDLACKIPILAKEKTSSIAAGCDSIRKLICDVTNFGKVVIKAEPASLLGDNFFSDTYLVDADIIDSKISLSVFAKVLPDNVVMRNAVYELRSHHREKDVYQYLFGYLYEIRGDLSIPLDVPDYYFGKAEEIVQGYSDGSRTCILLENLKELGYRMVEKSKGLDDNHVCLALTSLAHYHSLTIAALQKCIDSESLVNENSNYCLNYLKQKLESRNLDFLLEQTIADQSPVETARPWLDVFIDLVNDINRPDLSSWLSEVLKNVHEIMRLDTIESSGPLICILHGDYWSNNILFKYKNSCGNEDSKSPRADDEHIPVSIKMVDFQIARISHPMSDILYFLYTSTLPELRNKKSEEWLKLYFDVLLNNLKLLNVDLGNYSWETFLDDYKKRSLRWMIYCAMIISLVLNKVVVDKLNDFHQEEAHHKESQYVDDGSYAQEDNKEEEGDVSTKLAKKLSQIMKKHRLSKNQILVERLVSLFEEVKNLQGT